MDQEDQQVMNHQKWGERLEGAILRLDAALEGLCERERDWAPDDGIGSSFDHVLRIAGSARRLRRRLESSFESGFMSDGTLKPEFTEVVLMLKSSHDSILRQLRAGEVFNDCEESEALDREAVVYEHLVTLSHHVACMTLLQQLVDPSRQSALDCDALVIV